MCVVNYITHQLSWDRSGGSGGGSSVLGVDFKIKFFRWRQEMSNKENTTTGVLAAASLQVQPALPFLSPVLAVNKCCPFKSGKVLF